MSETLADGWVRLTWPDGKTEMRRVANERIISAWFADTEGPTVAQAIEWGYNLEPVVVLTVADHAALVARVKELEAQLANTQQWAGDAVACIRHGMELMPLDQFRHWTGVAAIEQVYSQMVEGEGHE